MRRVVRGHQLLIFSLMVCLAVSLPAQTSDDQLTVYAGSVVFNNPVYDTLVHVDFPFTLSRQQLEFFRPDSADPHFYGRVFAQVVLLGADGLPIDSNSTYFSVRVSSPKEAAGTEFTLFNRISLMVKPGFYNARVTVIDAVSKREGTFFLDSVVVKPGRTERLTIGGVCLARQIAYVGEEAAAGRMVFNGFQVLINPLRVFSYKDTVACLYAELYNLRFPEPGSHGYRLAYTALDNSGAIYRNFGYKLRDKPGSTAVVTERFDITGWTPGRYQLRMIATDLVTEENDTAMVDLTIVPEQRPVHVPDGLQIVDPYYALSLKEKKHLVTYLLTPDQKLTLSQLSPAGKENFLEQFWKEHDVDPSTRIIENRLEMIDRYNYCNRHFSYNEARTNGWSTDRGRIYMTYGPWEDHVDISAPIIGNPYIIWFYRSLKEGVVFVFEDKQGYNDYTLVHSNVEGERFNKEWDERLRWGQYDMY